MRKQDPKTLQWQTQQEEPGYGCLSITVGALTARGPPAAQKEHEAEEAGGFFPAGPGWVELISEHRKDQGCSSAPREYPSASEHNET